MARSRIIKPEFFRNADLYEAERDSGLPLRAAYAGLWTVTDRRGVFVWSRNLKPDVLPYDAVDILSVLETLERAGFVERYEVDGEALGFIPSFTKHQNFHMHERPSKHPAPPRARTGAASVPSDATNGPALDEHGANTIPAPEEHHTSPSASASTSTSTSTSTGDITTLAARRGGVKVQLARAANDALDAAFGTVDHRPPLLASSGAALLELLDAEQIPVDFAITAIQGAVPELKAPPRSLAYFTPIVRERWEQRQVERPTGVPARGPRPGSRQARNMAALAEGLRLVQEREAVANG